jgi:type II secretory pathway predicted ATPase ExeA
MNPNSKPLVNPFRPGAGHMPPYLAGRDEEKKEFRRLLAQTLILENLVLTGLRGLGKTVLLETFKPMAIAEGWLWAGTDLSESTSISEENLAIRILTDVSVVTSSIIVATEEHVPIGLAASAERIEKTLNFQALVDLYQSAPGLAADKLKFVLETVWKYMSASGKRGLIFAYDEAQNLADHSARNQFPLSLLLDVFQSIQRKNIPFMLALTGLPTLFPKLVQARTFAERMFRVVSLDPLTQTETVLAISEPTKGHQVQFSPASMLLVWTITGGYPYFVQYVCRETYDVWVQSANDGDSPAAIPTNEILRKLDTDFFAGRWAKATDRQRQLLAIVAKLPNCDGEFTVQEIIESPANTEQEKPFTSSHANQMLSSLADAGLIYKNRHGKYSFAVPLLGKFISRQSIPMFSNDDDL